MDDLSEAFAQAARLMVRADPEFVHTVALSIRVSGSATLLAALVGLPAGAWLALARFRGRGALVAVTNACLGVPSVVVGLLAYLAFASRGPFGYLHWLFTPNAMIAAQTVLITPMVAALARQAIEPAWDDYREQFASLRLSRARSVLTLLVDSRHALVTTVLAAFGRAIAEVGAVMTVGGNIAGVTRVMTTSIALESSKGDLPLALGLGIVLLAIVLAVTAGAQAIGQSGLQASR